MSSPTMKHWKPALPPVIGKLAVIFVPGPFLNSSSVSTSLKRPADGPDDGCSSFVVVSIVSGKTLAVVGSESAVDSTPKISSNALSLSRHSGSYIKTQYMHSDTGRPHTYTRNLVLIQGTPDWILEPLLPDLSGDDEAVPRPLADLQLRLLSRITHRRRRVRVLNEPRNPGRRLTPRRLPVLQVSTSASRHKCSSFQG